MRYHFTKHAKEKFVRMRQAGFFITQRTITSTIAHPLKTEPRPDGTIIASSILDEQHVLRVVYRIEKIHAIIIVITFYPGRRKAYAL